MLTVISIIGILMAIGAGMAGVASRRGKENRNRAELKVLELAIHAYAKDMGHYPPDNAVNGTNANPALNTLFYELTGAISTNRGQAYLSLLASGGSANLVPSTELQRLFHLQGVVNSSQSPEPGGKPRNYLPNLKAYQHRAISSSPLVELLVLRDNWPVGGQFTPPLSGVVADKALLRINPWRYVSTQPTNNPDSFDLWGDIVLGKQLRRIGNWKE